MAKLDEVAGVCLFLGESGSWAGRRYPLGYRHLGCGGFILNSSDSCGECGSHRIAKSEVEKIRAVDAAVLVNPWQAEGSARTAQARGKTDAGALVEAYLEAERARRWPKPESGVSRDPSILDALKRMAPVVVVGAPAPPVRKLTELDRLRAGVARSWPKCLWSEYW